LCCCCLWCCCLCCCLVGSLVGKGVGAEGKGVAGLLGGLLGGLFGREGRGCRGDGGGCCLCCCFLCRLRGVVGGGSPSENGGNSQGFLQTTIDVPNGRCCSRRCRRKSRPWHRFAHKLLRPINLEKNQERSAGHHSFTYNVSAIPED
jgi:hypothetical protein